MLKFNFKKYFFLIVACVLYSCQQYHRMKMEAEPDVKYKKLIESTGQRHSQPALPKFYVVLVPSFGVHASQTDAIKKQLEENFGEDIMVIQIKCLEEVKPTDPIGASQVEKMHQKILDKLIHKFHLENLNKTNRTAYLTLPMHLLGYEEPSIVPYINKPSYASIPFKHVFNIKTLSIAGVADNKNKVTIKHRPIKHFTGDKEKIIEDYIVFLKEQL